MIGKKFLLFLLMLFLLGGCLKKTAEDDKDKLSSNINECLVTYISGKASVIDESDKIISELTVGQNLNEKDILKTENESTVELQIGENSMIRVKDNSKIKILSLFNDQKTSNTKLDLEFGKVFAKPEKLNSGSIFEIQTKTITAGVRGTEFLVYLSENDKVIIAVNKGSVFVKKNIKLEEINNLSMINSGLADKIKNSVSTEIVLAQNEKVEIDNKIIEDYEKEIDNKITDIINNLEKNSESKEKLNEITAELDKVTIAQLNKESNKILTKEKITEKEWKDKLDNKEFDKMIIKQKDTKEKEENITDKVIKKDDIAMKDETNKEQKESKTDPAKIEKTTADEKRETINIIEKLPNSLGVAFSEKSTSVTTNGKYIFIANDDDNTIYCVNPADGSIVWKYMNEKLTKIQSSAVGYKGTVIIASYSNIFVLNSQGKLILEKSITNGPSFWADPILFGNLALIPTARTIYSYNGAVIDQLDESVFPSANSQLYISANDPDNIYIVDSLSKSVKVFDFTKKELFWTGDGLNDIAFSHAVRSGQFLVAADVSSSVYRFNFLNKETKPEILNINTGVISDIVSIGSLIYFVGKDGWLYRVNVNIFKSGEKLVKLDDRPDQDKYLIKKLIRKGSELYYSSDNGSLFVYDAKTGKYEFVKPQKEQNAPLISSPVIINDNIYAYDLNSNLYIKKQIFK